MYQLKFDGLYRHFYERGSRLEYAGLMCYGWLITRGGRLIARGHGAYVSDRDATSNVAEYLALINGLEALRDLGIREQRVRIIGDSQIVIRQMDGSAVVTAPRLQRLNQRASRVSNRFENVSWVWVPRRHNHEADRLSRHALQQIGGAKGNYNQYIMSVDQEQVNVKGFLPILDLCIFQPKPLYVN